VAIDVFSRMVMGVYLSLDAPSAMSVGLCLTNGILPKDEWLSKRHIDSTWPIYGVMDIVHADNAKEFRGEMIQKACKEYTVDLHWRPVGKPQFGAHIERLLGTFNQDIHTLPGTTFSNIKQRGEYDSDAMSAMTFEEFERWLGIYITKVYHNKLHKGLNTTPLAKYEEGILGTDKIPARGMPRLIGDKRKLQLDFMPFERRTIQKYGIATVKRLMVRRKSSLYAATLETSV
jgi:putative transposase